MKISALSILVFILIMSIGFVFIYLCYQAWYIVNYKTKQGWHKCYICKKSKSTMYYANKPFGKIYHCFECSKTL